MMNNGMQMGMPMMNNGMQMGMPMMNGGMPMSPQMMPISITTTSPLATNLPFTNTSIGSPAILSSSIIVPGAKSKISNGYYHA